MNIKPALSLVGAAALALFSASASAGYVASTWGDDSVHILDDNFNNVSSFAVGQSLPNGIGTDGTTIWVGTFVDSTVRAFDTSGNLLYSWGGSGFENLQGLDYMNGEIAIANGSQIQFRNALTGALNSSISGANINGTIEGIDFDGTMIWAVSDANLYGIDAATGNTLSTIPNAAAGCSFSGTGIASVGANQLALACANGDWFLVNKGDGSVVNSGNNQLQMFGLDYHTGIPPIPEPGVLALLAAVAPAALMLRRRRKVA